MLLASLSSCNKNDDKEDDTSGKDIPLLTPNQGTDTAEPDATTTEPKDSTGPQETTDEPKETTTEPQGTDTTEPPITSTTPKETTTAEPPVTTDPPATVTFTACDETVYVISSALNVRTAPSMDDNIYTQVAMGATLRRVGYNETWSKVIIEDKEYYVSTKYVSVDDPNEEVEFTARYETVYVTASLLNIRKTPSNVGDIYDTVPKGTEVIRIGYNENWSKIMYDGEIYYAGSKYLSTENPGTEATTTTAAPSAQ